MTHKRFLWTGNVVPACGAETANGVSLSDKWAVVTCTECLRCRPTATDTVKKFARMLARSVGWGVLAVAMAVAVAALLDDFEAAGALFALGPGIVAVFSALATVYWGVLLLAGLIVQPIVWWRGVERADPPTWVCVECSKVFLGRSGFICDECAKPQLPAEPRWAHLLNRTDVVVLDVSTFGSLDTDAEVKDTAVIDTQGNVLLHDLWAQALRAQPPNHILRRPRYHDVLGPVMRVLRNASVICVYNAEFDISLIQRQVERHGRDSDLDAEIVCIQREYAAHYTPDGTWLKLGEAARRESVLNEVGEPHPPLNDVRLTLGIMCKVVAREQRARGLPIGDALAPNYSGT